MIGYTPQSAAARKTLFKQWKVLALALVGCGLVVFLFMHFTGKDTVPKERKETPTKFEITPNETWNATRLFMMKDFRTSRVL